MISSNDWNPSNWSSVKLGDVADKRTTKVNPQDCPELVFIGLDAIEPNSINVNVTQKFSELKSSANEFFPDDILYGRMRPYLNKVCIAETHGACSGEFIVLKKTDELNTKYLLWVIHSLDFVRFANSKTTGDRPRVTYEEISEYPIALPPLAEQHRIVARIEELFSSLGKGVEALKTAQQQLKVYRQAVLKWAFEGRLTHPDLEEGVLPEGWVERPLGKIVKTTSGGTPSRKEPQYFAGNIPWIKSGELTQHTVYHAEEHISESAVENSSAKIFPKGTLLIALYGATIGKLAFLGIDAATNQAICAIFPSVELNMEYLYHYLNFQKQNLIESAIGGAQPNISQSILRDLLICFPIDEHEQGQIVQEIESRLSVCDKIEEDIVQSLERADALRQSILKQAFEGRLVEQDPDDEPASALLERIKSLKPPIKKKS